MVSYSGFNEKNTKNSRLLYISDYGIELVESAYINFNHSIDKLMTSKVCNEITYSFLNFNVATVRAWEWKSNYISHIITVVITYPRIMWQAQLAYNK